MLLQNLRSKRLDFRRLCPEDASTLLQFFQHEEATRLFAIYQNDPQAHAHARIESQMVRYEKDGDGLCAIVNRESGALVGQCGLLWQIVDGIRELEVGYHLQPDHWKKGYATEAANAVRDFAFEQDMAPSIISIIDIRNKNSQQVAQRNGMQLDKQTKKGGTEVFIYRITRTEWERNKKRAAPIPQ